MKDQLTTLLARAEAHADETAANLSRLVQIPSVSLQEKQVIHELANQMEAAGFDEVRIDGLGNVIGRIGSGSRMLAFDAHMDTVDVGERGNWSFDPFGGEVRDGYVYGRGSVDQEGGAVAFVTAGKILREIGYDRDLTLLFTGTVMEEDCDGLCWKYLIEEEQIRPQLVVSTEPTNLNIYRGHRGRMEIHAEFTGISAHGSAPERGDNAIYKMARGALAIEQLNTRLKDDPFLGQGSVTLSEALSGSPSLCAVADYARLHLDRRLTRGETRESALAEVREALQGLDAQVSVLNYEEVSWTGKTYGMEKYYPTWLLDESHPAVQTAAHMHRQVLGRKPHIGKWTFSTNGVTINGLYDIPVIGFGPGNEVMAHAPDEKVSIEHLNQAAAFYAGLALTY